MSFRSSRFAVICLVTSFALLGTLAFAGSAEAIFFPCRGTCDNGAPPSAKCSYYQGDGSCAAYPNPCYMTCSKYWSCTSSPQPFADGVDADGSETLSGAESEITFGQNFASWLEEMSYSYGPCLEIVSSDGKPEATEIAPTLQLGTHTDGDSEAATER